MGSQPYDAAMSVSSAAVPARARSSTALALAGMVTLAAAMGIGRFAFTPVLPMMRADAGLTLAAAGWLASANYVGYFVGALAAVWLRVSPAALVRGSLVAIAVLTAAMGLTVELGVWLLLRFLAGVASAWALVFSSAWVLQRLAARGRPALGAVMFAGVGVGIVLAGLLTLGFLAAAWSSARAWMALGAAALVLAAAAWPAYAADEAPAPGRSAPEHPLRAARRHGRLVACYGAFGFGYIIPATFLPEMAKEAVGNPAVFGWAWPLFGVAGGVSVLVAGRLSAWFSDRALWAAGSAVMAAGVAVPVVVPGIVGIALSALAVGGTFLVVTVAAMQEARRAAPDAAASLIAAMTAVFALGQIAGPVVAGALVERQGSFAAALVAAALLLGASAWALAPSRRREETKP